MEAITLTINGQAISALAGKTVLEVARQHDIPIPTLCHHEFLRPIGACRVCQVEDETRGVVVPACVTKIQQGMSIVTDSPSVVRNRRNIVRMLMAAHPESCVVCEKGNRCELRLLAAQMGIGQHGLDPMPYHPSVQDLNPFLTRDLSKCILCAKCLRADQDLVVEGVIDYRMRGFDAHPSSLFHAPLEHAECTFCGTCLSVCPTAAIAEKGKRRLDHAGSRTGSVCSFCACGCSIALEHDGTRVRGVVPAGRAASSNGITMCVKGHFGHDYLDSPERLRTPLVRNADGFDPISWDQALDLAARELGRIHKEHGPHALGFMGSERATNEELYLFQKLARNVFGTNNIDLAAGSGWTRASRVLSSATGFAAGSSSMRDIEQSRTILVIGGDPTRTAPVLGFHIKRAVRDRAASLIVADPFETQLTRFASLWLRPRVATDLALVNGLAKTIVEEDLYDKEFVLSKTLGFDALRSYLDGVVVSRCAEESGVEEEELRQAARSIAGAETASIVFGGGIMGQPQVSDLTAMLVNLALLTGNIGKHGAGVFPLVKSCNTQGACDMGASPTTLPGYAALDDADARRILANAWGTPPPEQPGLDAAGMIEASRNGTLKGLFVFCENPLGVLPDRSSVEQAIERLEFVIVQDLFMTETARHAHLVLPASAFSEKRGTVTNLERRVQKLVPAVPPPGDFPPEWQVLCRLAAELGRAWEYDGPEGILKEIEKVAPIYGGVSRTDLDNKPFFWPLPGLGSVSDTMPHGIGHKDGKALFRSPEGKSPLGVPEEKGYPFVLMQGHILQHLGTGARTFQSKRLRQVAPEALLGVCPEDMAALGVREGDPVRVRSAHGAVEIRVTEEPRLPKSLLFMPASFPDIPHNVLFGAKRSGAGEPSIQKHCRVSVEPL